MAKRPPVRFTRVDSRELAHNALHGRCYFRSLVLKRGAADMTIKSPVLFILNILGLQLRWGTVWTLKDCHTIWRFEMRWPCLRISRARTRKPFLGRTEKTLETGNTVRRTKTVCGY